MDSCLVVKQDGLSLVVAIAVDLLEQVPVSWVGGMSVHRLSLSFDHARESRDLTAKLRACFESHSSNRLCSEVLVA